VTEGSLASNSLSCTDYSADSISETSRRSQAEGEVEDEVVEVDQNVATARIPYDWDEHSRIDILI
jgi:hypothetical protein